MIQKKTYLRLLIFVGIIFFACKQHDIVETNSSSVPCEEETDSPSISEDEIDKDSFVEQLSEERGIQIVTVNKFDQNPILVNDVICLILPYKSDICIDGVYVNNSKDKSAQLLSFTHLTFGWHEIQIMDIESKYILYLNHISGLPNLLVSEKIIKDGRYAKRTRYNKKYLKYLRNDYSIDYEFLGWYGGDYSNCIYDENGIPMVNYYGSLEYNPVVIAQFALSFYNGKEIINTDDSNHFLEIASFLCDYISDDGGAPYNFEYSIHGIPLNNPWYSAMAQGHILSVFSRAYLINGEEKYILKGKKVFDFMVNSCKVDLASFTQLHPDLTKYQDYYIYEEYVAKIGNYVLNGNLFALIGLHDWYELTNNSEVLNAFLDGCKTIELLLPYYDYYGTTSYDLVHLVNNTNWIEFDSTYAHDYHIVLLDALFKFTNNQVFEKYKDIFISYYEDPIYN